MRIENDDAIGPGAMRINLSFTILPLLLLAACAPQAELVKTRSDVTDLRDDANQTKQRVQEVQKRLDKDLQSVQKRLDAIDANVRGTVDAQKVMADYGAKSDQLLTDIQLLQGKLEENNYRLAELAQKIDDRGVKLAELVARVEALEARVKTLGSAGTGTAATAATATTDKDRHGAARTVDPSEAYRQAKTDFDKGSFDLALAGFQNYLAQYPDASQADNAQYWIGECYYSKKDFPKAIEAFSRVTKNHPKSDKAPGALLKIGLSYLNEKNSAKAKEFLSRVIKEHPGTNEAEIAKDRLHKLGK
jgi:tol-pal system protein YbgF